MDLYAYMQKDILSSLLPSIPARLRGIRLMVLEDLSEYTEEELSEVPEAFKKYAGQDVLYVHTRCGECAATNGKGNGNYSYFGLDVWEEELGDLLLHSEDENFDCTYRDTYIKVPEDKMELYKEILAEYTKED